MTQAIPGETRNMRLLSRALGEQGPLSRFIAIRREPGRGWMTWEQVARDLHRHSGEHFTREGLHLMAKRYQIPDSTRDGDARKYWRELKVAGIEV